MFAIALTIVLFSQPNTRAGEIPDNLVFDPHADAGGARWLSNEEATTESIDGNRCFVIRNRGLFSQTVKLPPVPAGTHVVFLARASSERIRPQGAITGLAYLYGQALDTSHKRVLMYFQGQGMLSTAKNPNEWTTLWGVFEVPPGAASIVVQLGLAEGRGVPQNGSAARFDDIALVLVPTAAAGRSLIERYR